MSYLGELLDLHFLERLVQPLVLFSRENSLDVSLFGAFVELVEDSWLRRPFESNFLMGENLYLFDLSLDGLLFFWNGLRIESFWLARLFFLGSSLTLRTYYEVD